MQKTLKWMKFSVCLVSIFVVLGKSPKKVTEKKNALKIAKVYMPTFANHPLPPQPLNEILGHIEWSMNKDEGRMIGGVGERLKKVYSPTLFLKREIKSNGNQFKLFNYRMATKLICSCWAWTEGVTCRLSYSYQCI